MNRVSASEFDLLAIVRALFDTPGWGHSGQLSGAISSLLLRSRRLPDGIGPTARRLIEDTMAKGLILALIRRGGWRRESFVSDAQVVDGRLWQRHGPPDFHLSPFALHLCRWLTEERLRRGECTPLADHIQPATVADEIMLYLAFDLTERARCAEALAEQPCAQSSGLCWLGFADVLGMRVPANAELADVSVYRITPWMSGAGVMVLEALQPDLTRRWVAMERYKRRLGRGPGVVAIGRAQEAVLEACFSALSRAARPDLARFAILATRELLRDAPAPRTWEPTLESGSALRVRSDTRRAAAVLLRAMAVVRRWVDQARTVRFFDDGYDCAQLVLRLWEQLGDRAYERAMFIARELESIDGLIQ